MEKTNQTMAKTGDENPVNRTSIKEYKESWTSHVDDLGRMCWNLTQEEHKELREIQDKLRVLVEKATKDLQKRRSN